MTHSTSTYFLTWWKIPIPFFWHLFLAVNCVWGDWVIGTCSAECGAGTRTNTRVKIVPESNGGTCCGVNQETVECQEKECPGRYYSRNDSSPHITLKLLFQNLNTAKIVDLVNCEWNDWIIGDCSQSCGGGTRNLTRTINQTALYGGDECPDKDVTSIEESCNVEECPGDRNVQYNQC